MDLPERAFVLVGCVAALASPADGRNGARAEDWPWWNGPARNGVSHETDWSPEGAAEPLWSAKVGLGYSSCAIRAGKVYTLGHDAAAGRDTVHCLDALTGATLWTHSFASKLWDQSHGGGTLTTPTVDTDRVYVSEREGELLCLDAADGSVRWRHQAAEELGVETPEWGLAASPLLFGEQVVLNYGRVIAFDRDDGAVLWKSARDYGHAYSTPIDLDYKGTHALMVFDGAGLAVVALDDGRELAFLPFEATHKVKAMTPVLFDLRVFVSAYPWGAAMVDFAGDEPERLWASRVMQNQMSGAVPWDGHLYGFDVQVLKCIHPDGRELWRERGIGAGALTIAGGRLLVISGEGELIVADATPDGFRPLARRKVLAEAGAPFWTVPVLANGIVYARSHGGELVALDHRPAR
jgi:outer membrane protein assembly factor BamB